MTSKNKTIGFVNSDKPFEYRLALLPADSQNIKNKEYVYIEEGYGFNFNIDDSVYQALGFHVVPREEVLSCDIICDPKIGEALYLEKLKEATTLFGWIHAVENPTLTNLLLRKKFCCYAWEDMFKDNRHIFWKNNYIAGESAVLHAVITCGLLPKNHRIAIIGRGNTAMGACQMIHALGGNVEFFNRNMEALLRQTIDEYDIVINTVLWNPARIDHILYHSDLQRMKPNALIIDVSADNNGAIEDAHATARDQPTFKMDGVTIYAVNNTPSLLFQTATKTISPLVAHYVDQLITGQTEEELDKCKIIDAGIIYDKKINIRQTL